MRLFKATYRDRKGQKRTAAKWYIEFRDHRDRVRRLAAFSDKTASAELGRKVQRLVAYKVTGQPPDAELRRWLETLPASLRKALAKIGVLDSRRFAAAKPLTDHVSDFSRHLIDRGNTEAYADLTVRRLRILLEGIGATYWSEISAATVQRYLAERRALPHDKGNLSVATCNHYTVALKNFCRWMVRDGRASESPVAHLQRLNARTDRRRERRALSLDESRRLLKAASEGPPVQGLTGRERAMVYRVALETGLRARELKSLTRASFNLDSAPPTVTVEAAYSKRRQRDCLPLRRGTAEALRIFLAGKAPAAQAFHWPKRWKSAEMLQADLKATGIAYRDEEGRVVDFHALRHTFITNLANSGVHPKVAQALARHSSITFTMDVYTHTVVEQLTDALDALPDLAAPPAQEARATGTYDGNDGHGVLASCLAREAADRGAPLAAIGRQASQKQDAPAGHQHPQEAHSEAGMAVIGSAMACDGRAEEAAGARGGETAPDGQNVLYLGGEVEWHVTPFCGAMRAGFRRDNIYWPDAGRPDDPYNVPRAPADSFLVP